METISILSATMAVATTTLLVKTCKLSYEIKQVNAKLEALITEMDKNKAFKR